MDYETVKEIVELYEYLENEERTAEREWAMDEDQTGIPYPYELTREDLYRDVAAVYNKKHNKRS